MKKRPVRRMIAAALALIMLLAASATAYAEEPVIGEEEQEIQEIQEDVIAEEVPDLLVEEEALPEEAPDLLVEEEMAAEDALFTVSEEEAGEALPEEYDEPEETVETEEDEVVEEAVGAFGKGEIETTTHTTPANAADIKINTEYKAEKNVAATTEYYYKFSLTRTKPIYVSLASDELESLRFRFMYLDSADNTWKDLRLANDPVMSSGIGEEEMNVTGCAASLLRRGRAAHRRIRSRRAPTASVSYSPEIRYITGAPTGLWCQPLRQRK